MRVVYRWPDVSTPEGLTGIFNACKEAAGARCATGQILNRFVIHGADSFLVVSWPERNLKVAIAFGFVPGEGSGLDLPKELSGTLQLAALATWAEYEVRRLERDVCQLNERLGRRTIIDRAKGLLQAKHGWSEQQAYEHLRRLSRQRRIRMAETAHDLVRMLQRT